MAGSGFTYGNVDLGALGLIVERAPDQAMADVNFDIALLGGADGGVSQAAGLKPRYWTMTVRILGTSLDVLRARMDAIRAALDPRGGDQLLVMDMEDLYSEALQRGRMCRLNGPINATLEGLSYITQLNFAAADPCEVAVVESTQTVTLNASPKTIDVPADVSDGGTPPHMVAVNAPGNTYAKPVWTLTNGGAEPVTSVTVANATTGDTFVWTGSLQVGERLRVDAARQHCERSMDGTTWTAAMSGVSGACPFPRILGGVQNAVTITGIGTGTMGIVYRGRFL